MGAFMTALWRDAFLLPFFFDGNQSGQQAFMKLIKRQYRISGSDIQNDIGNNRYNIDKTQYASYTEDGEANVGGTTVGFAENGGQHDGF